MISRYRMALMQVVDLCCILLALAVSGMVTIAPDLSVFDDYTGASLFTIFFYLLFFYILDAYSVGMEDFKDTLGRILVACVLGIISSATASFALENWRFDRVTVLLLFALSFVFCLGWRFLYYLNADKLTHPLRVLLVGVDRGGKACPRPVSWAMWAKRTRTPTPVNASARPSWPWKPPSSTARP